ncbi:Uncharacterised protein [Candidatus Gugararchaeum adminiculabundum]|nr:Uncharacterised protein [Candidatus Gugararchaeum adminiculabundum]
MSKNDAYDISIHVEPSGINETLAFLHNQIIRQTSDLIASTAKGTPNPSLEIKLSDTKKLHDALYKGEEKMFNVSLYINNKARDKKTLNMLLEKCRANLNSLLIIPEQVEYNVVDGLISALPIGVDKMREQREFTTSALAATFPFLSTSSPDKTGILFAHEEDSKTPIFIDFGSMSNKHFFIIGITGSGKSYAAKYLMMQALIAENPRIYILDPNAEYSDLCQELGGENIELSRYSQNCINVFDLAGEDFGDKLLSLLSVFDIITGGLSEAQKGVLNDVLPRAYAKKEIRQDDASSWGKEPPTFGEVFAEIRDFLRRYSKKSSQGSQDLRRSAEVLMNRVGMYTKPGFFSFLDKQSKLNMGKRMMNFDLSALPAAVKPVVMFSVMDLIAREIKRDKEPKIFLIDEGWALLKSKETANYLLDFIKTSRKFGASIGFISQEIEDLMESESGRSILNMTSTKILMKQNSSNIDLIHRNMRLNEHERDFLLRCKKGHGLLITERGHYKFFTFASPKMHGFITTDPKEISDPKRREAMEKKLKQNEEMRRLAETASRVAAEEKDPLRELGINERFFLARELNKKQTELLIEREKFEAHEVVGLGRKGRKMKVFVRLGKGEGFDHFALRKLIERELKARNVAYTPFMSEKPDIVFNTGKADACFEIETGKNKKKQVEEKMKRLEKEYGVHFIVVTKWKLKRKYRDFKSVISRAEVIEELDKLFK